MLGACAMTGGDIDTGEIGAKFTLGLMFLIIFMVMHWIINIPYVRITGLKGIKNFGAYS
jgi:hypothetical protein